MNKFWLTISGLTPFDPHSIAGTSSSGSPIYCGHCPCVDGYAVFAFVKYNQNSSGTVDYCYQYIDAAAGAICDNKIYWKYDYQQIPITVSRGSKYDKIGTYDGCVLSGWDWQTESYGCLEYGNIEVYLLTDIYSDYDSFREQLFSPCSAQLSSMIFAGGKYPCHIPNMSQVTTNCINNYWKPLAQKLYAVKTYWTINRRRFYTRLQCGSNYWTTRQDPQDPLKYNYYYGQYIINNDPWQAFGYYGCHQQRSPSQCSTQEWTLDKTRGWLGQGITGINTQITRYLNDLTLWQESDVVSGVNNRCYDQFPYHNSRQSCPGATHPCNDAKQLQFSYYDIRCYQHPDAPSAAIGIKAILKWTKKDYNGEYDPETYQPIYTYSSGVITKDFRWTQLYKTPVADNIPHAMTQADCTDANQSRPGPCNYSYSKYTWTLIAKEYLY